MNILIYESSSFGGCYDYAKELAKAYANSPQTEKVTVLLPRNSTWMGENVKAILCADKLNVPQVWAKKIAFLWRQLANPMRLFFYLLGEPPSVVLLNDFEQLTAFVWGPLYRLFLRKHRFGVMLHDPDRDAYPPSPRVSAWQMRCLLRAMDLGFYHELLPQKTYYQTAKRTQFVAVPHGIYPPYPADAVFSDYLRTQKAHRFAFALLGNIRAEKNIGLAIRALLLAPEAHLFIAGRPSNSSVNIEFYKSLAVSLEVADRITWVNRFLTFAEMSSVIDSSDAVLLYYKTTFVSQSAIINQVAPFRKPLIVTDAPSALAATARRFGNALLLPPDSAEVLAQGMHQLQETPNAYDAGWDAYLKYASWEQNCTITLGAFRALKPR